MIFEQLTLSQLNESYIVREPVISKFMAVFILEFSILSSLLAFNLSCAFV
jgi:hypothetical protein